MLRSTATARKWLAALSGCALLVIGALSIPRSEAQSAKAGAPSPTGAVGSTRAVPIFGIKIPAGYRDWKLISVAHEEGSLNDIRAILGNDLALKAYRQAKLPFPEGAIIARVSWIYVPSEENNKVFGRSQSFVAGSAPEWYLQFMVKDSKKYAATRGWGYAQFDKDGNPAGEAKLKTCAPCHEAIPAGDFVFTHYAP